PVEGRAVVCDFLDVRDAVAAPFTRALAGTRHELDVPAEREHGRLAITLAEPVERYRSPVVVEEAGHLCTDRKTRCAQGHDQGNRCDENLGAPAARAPPDTVPVTVGRARKRGEPLAQDPLVSGAHALPPSAAPPRALSAPAQVSLPRSPRSHRRPR